MPTDSFARILELAGQGGVVFFNRETPSGPPGLGHLKERNEEFKRLRGTLQFELASGGSVDVAEIGRGRVYLGGVIGMLAQAKIPYETLIEHGLEFIRRRFDDGRAYFIVNRSETPFDGWTPLATRAASAVLFDPAHDRRGVAAIRQNDRGEAEAYLQLAPGESCVLRTYELAVEGQSFPYLKSAGAAQEVSGKWAVEFVSGGPTLPTSAQTESLGSWAELGGDEHRAFSGTARYSSELARPDGQADGWWLDLGQVHEIAAVKLDGKPLGTLITAPFRVFVPADRLTAGTHKLEIDVANLMANRIADMERRGETAWKKFYNINFPPRLPENRGRDGLFTAAAWKPRASGLMGPVTLTPVKIFSPQNESAATRESSVGAVRRMESLDRGVVAIRTDGGVFVSWRLLWRATPTKPCFTCTGVAARRRSSNLRRRRL
jgi:hypothetical protein